MNPVQKPQLSSAIVRVLDSHQTDAPIGVGFQVSPTLFLTCAHVVADALHIPRKSIDKPLDILQVDFPFRASNPPAQAKVKQWFPLNEHASYGELEDVALVFVSD